MTVLVPEESQRLHRLIAYYQVPLGLSQDQQAGAACVWCGGPAGPDAVGLEYPGYHGCPDCYLARISWLITWYAWQQHVLDCTPCRQQRTCYVGRGRRIRHELTIVPAGKEPLFCSVCHRPVDADEPAMPVFCEGDSGTHLGYGHTHCLAQRAVTR